MDIMVSIIVPVYNVELYVEKCLDSIVNQTYKNVEIIVINDGSSDCSGIICMKRAKREGFIYISKINEGLGATRNLGMKIAKGEYILFVDSDDWLAPDAVEKMVKYIKREEQTDVIALSQYYEFDNKTKALKIIKQNEVIGTEALFEEIRKRYYLLYGVAAMWGKLFRKEFLLKNNIWMPNIMHEDNAVFPEIIFCAKSIKFYNEPLYFYRVNRNGSILNSNENYTYMSEACESFLDYFKKYKMMNLHYAVIKHYVETRLIGSYISYCQNELDKNLQRTVLEKFTKLYKKYFGGCKPYWKYKFAVLGSFGSRWIAHALGTSKEQLIYHIPFSSVIAQMRCEEVSKYKIYNKNEFRCEKVKNDIEGAICHILENESEQIDFFLIDFLEERYDVAELKSGNFITLSEAFMDSSFEGLNIKRVIKAGSKEHFEIWKHNCRKLVKLLKTKLKYNQIILIKSRLTTKYEKENGFKIYPNQEVLKEQNLLIERMEHYFLYLTENQIQTYAYPENIYTEKNFRLGIEPQYLGEHFYQRMKMQIVACYDM